MTELVEGEALVVSAAMMRVRLLESIKGFRNVRSKDRSPREIHLAPIFREEERIGVEMGGQWLIWRSKSGAGRSMKLFH